MTRTGRIVFLLSHLCNKYNILPFHVLFTIEPEDYQAVSPGFFWLVCCTMCVTVPRKEGGREGRRSQ